MNLSMPDVFAELKARDLVADAQPPVLQAEPPGTPWFVRVMAGFGAWLGGLFLLGSVLGIFAFAFNSKGGMLVLGVLLIGAAFAIYRAAGESEALQQFGLAFSMAGQFSLGFGLSDILRWSSGDFVWALCLMQVALVALMPNSLHRFLSTLFAVIAGYYALQLNYAVALGAVVMAPLVAWIWVYEAEWTAARRASLWRPVGYALALGLLFWQAPLSARWIFGGGREAVTFAVPYWFAPLAYAGSLVAVAGVLARQLAPTAWLNWVIAAALVSLAAILAPGLIAALLVLVLGFAAGNRILTGMAILAAAWYLGAFYYQMQITLLEKSGVMLATGVLLLAMRFALPVLWRKEAGHE
jgi:uncharacterized membrane protein